MSVSLLAAFMVGHFSNAAQVAENPAAFSPVSYDICEVDTAPSQSQDADGEDVRLLLASQTISLPGRAPLVRNRIYRLERTASGAIALSASAFDETRIDPGTCTDGPAARRRLDASAIRWDASCVMTFAYDDTRKLFAGSTAPGGCASTFQGAVKMIADETIADGRIAPWERWYDAAGKQVAGSTAGPYVYLRTQRPEPSWTPAARTLGLQEFLKLRCDAKGARSYMHWQGSVYSTVPGEEAQRRLFDIIGVNVARCLPGAQGGAVLTSRELTFYLDPATGRVLDSWQNPWTGESVPVAHVANDPVQHKMPASLTVPLLVNGALATVKQDVNLTYPNVLARDARFAPYAPDVFYKASEFFHYAFPSASLAALSTSHTIDDVQFHWVRSGQWLPWMKMGTRAGGLLYSASGVKVARYGELPSLLRDTIARRGLLAYRDAPRCVVEGPSATSWNTFARDFDLYASGVSLPRAAPLRDVVCAPAPAP